MATFIISESLLLI